MRTSVSITLAAALLAAPLLAVGAGRGRRRPHPDHADAVDRQRGLPHRHPRGGQAHRRQARPGPTGRAAHPRVRRPLRRRHVAQLRDGHLDLARRRARVRRRRGDLVVEREHADGHVGRDALPRPAHRRVVDQVVRAGSLDLRPRLRRGRHPPHVAGRAERHRRPDPHRHVQHPLGPRAGRLPDAREPAASGRRLRLAQARRGHDHDQRADPGLRGHERVHAGASGGARRAGVRAEHPLRRVPRVRRRWRGLVLAHVDGDGDAVLRLAALPLGRRPRRHRGAERRPAGRPRRDERVGLHLRRRGQLAVQRGVRRDVPARRVRHPPAVPGRRSSASSRPASRSSPRCRGTSRRCRRRATTPTGTCW